MFSLSAVASRAAERRRSNLAKLAALTSRLDDPLFSDPTPDPSPMNRSTPPPTQRTEAHDAEIAASRLPARTTHGGPYGASIIDRVLASYGLD